MLQRKKYVKLDGLIPKKEYYVVTTIQRNNENVEISVKEYNEESTNVTRYKYVINNEDIDFSDTHVIYAKKVIFNHIDMKPRWKGGKTRKRERRRKSKRTRKNRRSRRRRRSS